jgi:hypothetical protein
MDLDDLLIECIDALQVPARDSSDRAEHFAFIKEALSRDSTPSEVREVLKNALEILGEQQKKHVLDLSFDLDARALKLVATIQSNLTGSVPRFVYHGTIYGRLADICQSGLLPGKARVWNDRYVSRKVLDTTVFFDTTWRGALSWAEIAHHHSKGRIDGLRRTPAVIRPPPEKPGLLNPSMYNTIASSLVASIADIVPLLMNGASRLLNRLPSPSG